MESVQQLIRSIESCDGELIVVAGAGLSTASGIGDYRDHEGAYKRPPPVTVQAFLGSPAARQRYWARSLYGWPSFAAARPNAAHSALAALEAEGWVSSVITQNVDGLHQVAGTERLIELHGNLHRVACVACGDARPRAEFQHQLRECNPHLLGLTATPAPDGDADLEPAALDQMQVPDCAACGGILKPTVVFFGDTVPKPVVADAYRRVDAARGLLILGSSVMIHSSYRFCRRARDRGIPQFAVNQGRTRADDWLALKVEAPCEAVLPRVCAGLGIRSTR